jgi:polar amino acid transport system substrate-binding protein
MTRRTPRLGAVAGIAAVAALALAGCSSASSTGSASAASGSTAQAAVSIPEPAYSAAIHNELPASIKSSGVLNLAAVPLPPYVYYASNGTTVEGMNVDMATALQKVLGVKVNLSVAPTITEVFSGMESGRYDASIASLSDVASTEKSYDFADWLKEYVVFLAEKSTSDPVDSLTTACGHTIATIQGGTAQTVLTTASKACVAAGKKPITISLFADQSTAILAVESGRADAAFSSQMPLSYYVKQNPSLSLEGANSTSNGFPPFYVGAFAPKSSGLAQPLLDAFKAMQEAGTYKALLAKYGIAKNAISTFGINLSTQNG